MLVSLRAYCRAHVLLLTVLQSTNEGTTSKNNYTIDDAVVQIDAAGFIRF